MKKIPDGEIIIRDATVWDAKDIADMWELEVNEMEMVGTYCDEEEKRRFFLDIISKIANRNDNNVVLVAEYNKKVISFITAITYYVPFGNSKMTCFCEHRYVYPEYRKTKIGKRMVQAIIEDTTIKGAKVFEFTAPFREGLVKVYKRMGYTPISVIFRKERE